MKSVLKITMTGVAAAAIAMSMGSCSKEEPGAEAKSAAVEKAAYPLDTCVVSGEKLDSMGKPYVITYEGREVRFCCDGCEEDFRKEPAKFLAKIDAAAK